VPAELESAQLEGLFASIVPEPSTAVVALGMLAGLTLRGRRN
jgi:MYXO-CTERM domain-containing protein